MWIELSEWAKSMSIFVSHVNAHLRVTSVNQVNRTTCSVNTSQILFPATPVIANGLMNKVAIVAGMEVMHRLSNMRM